MALRLLEIADGFSSPSVPSDIALPTGIFSGNLFFDYAVTNVTTSAWVQLIASTSDIIRYLTLFDSCGSVMEIGIGATPARLFLVPPGGFNGALPFPIPSGSKVSIRAVSADALSGFIVANFLK